MAQDGAQERQDGAQEAVKMAISVRFWKLLGLIVIIWKVLGRSLGRIWRSRADPGEVFWQLLGHVGPK